MPPRITSNSTLPCEAPLELLVPAAEGARGASSAPWPWPAIQARGSPWPAGSDGVHVDQQFRRASRLAVYQLDAAWARLDQTFTFAPEGSVRTEERLEAIGGAAIVVGTVFGPSSVARLAERGIRAATARPGTRIAELLARFARLEREAHVPGPS